jgi:hypothetical protein
LFLHLYSVDTFFGTCLADASAKKAAVGAKTGRYGIAADGAGLALMVYVSKILRRVRVLRELFYFVNIIFFLVKLCDVVIDWKF